MYLLLPIEGRKLLDAKYIDLLLREVLSTALPAEAKVAFLKYIQATERAELQRLRGQIMTAVFNAETAFSISKSFESNISSWCESMENSLEPDIALLDAADQKRIIAVLAKEKADAASDGASIALFERLMKFL